MIAALFVRNKETMKFSNGKAILFISKLGFSLLAFIWLLSLAMMTDIILKGINIIYQFPKSRLAYVLILLMIYFIINPTTWSTSVIESYVEDKNNYYEIKKATWLFYSLLLIGFILLIGMAFYNKWHSNEYSMGCVPQPLP